MGLFSNSIPESSLFINLICIWEIKKTKLQVLRWGCSFKLFRATYFLGYFLSTTSLDISMSRMAWGES